MKINAFLARSVSTGRVLDARYEEHEDDAADEEEHFDAELLEARLPSAGATEQFAENRDERNVDEAAGGEWQNNLVGAFAEALLGAQRGRTTEKRSDGSDELHHDCLCAIEILEEKIEKFRIRG